MVKKGVINRAKAFYLIYSFKGGRRFPARRAIIFLKGHHFLHERTPFFATGNLNFFYGVFSLWITPCSER
jgi:hypothetical protein